MNGVAKAPSVHPSSVAQPIARPRLCRLAQPLLRDPQRTPRFLFHEATILLVEAGELSLNDGRHHLSVRGPRALVLVRPRTTATLDKQPTVPTGAFRSVFLEISSTVLASLETEKPASPMAKKGMPSFAAVEFDNDLESSLRTVIASVRDTSLSDARVRYRLLDLLTALSERGSTFDVPPVGTADRLRGLISERPAHRWTARDAGRALAISEATLRRRMANDGERFEDLVVDVRMHHAMMLLQTTSWTIEQVAAASGYRSRGRFSDRFRDRFGYLPSSVR